MDDKKPEFVLTVSEIEGDSYKVAMEGTAVSYEESVKILLDIVIAAAKNGNVLGDSNLALGAFFMNDGSFLAFPNKDSKLSDGLLQVLREAMKSKGPSIH